MNSRHLRSTAPNGRRRAVLGSISASQSRLTGYQRIRREQPSRIRIITYYACPACDFAGLDAKPYEEWPLQAGVDLVPPYRHQLGRPSYGVCLRCGFEFGNNDDPGTAAPSSFEEYRSEWQAEGAPWFNKLTSLGFARAANDEGSA
jgi:hypothetical protein